MRGQYFQERQNSQSITKKTHLYSRHVLDQSINSSSLARKMSLSSLKNYVDIDRLIQDIKIVPQKSSQISEHIKIIISSLNILKRIPNIIDEVRTIQLLLDSITKKMASDALTNTRVRHSQSSHKQSSRKNSNVSPVKQFDQNSRIVYTNFSLKQIQLPNHQFQRQKQRLETPVKKYIYEKDENYEMQRLNNQIVALEKMLKNKGVVSDFKKIDIPSATSIQKSQYTNNSTNKSKLFKDSAAVPRKYTLLQKTHEMNLIKSKGLIQQRPKIVRGSDNSYR